MADDPWRSWQYDSPYPNHERVEIVRPKAGQAFEECEHQIVTISKIPDWWNVSGVYWRPFY